MGVESQHPRGSGEHGGEFISWKRRSLYKNEYIYAVSLQIPDDGTTNYIAYFTDRETADALAKAKKGHVVQTTLYTDDWGKWWRLTQEEVHVNIPDRQDVLAKLTQAERISLGFK